jgi:predicted lipid-binding transport protein (Tim44 family)
LKNCGNLFLKTVYTEHQGLNDTDREDFTVPADLIIYAIITAGLIFWLRSILGTRHGEERDRSAPYLKPENGAPGNVIVLGEKNDAGESKITELMKNPKNGMSVESTSAEDGLLSIARADRSFDIIKFLFAAQDAFVFIVESFADGDRETLRDLLAPEVCKSFETAITEREAAGYSVKTDIIAIKQSVVTEAKTDGRFAFVSVRFYAEETSVTKDKNGEIISGHPEKVIQMRDLWTFSRDLKSRDPRWMLVATREDGADDNQSIPNTDS